jgi:hypothetical protein
MPPEMATQARKITLQIRLSDKRSPELLHYVLALRGKGRARQVRTILEDALEQGMLGPDGALRNPEAQISTLTAEIRRIRNAQLGDGLLAEVKRLGDVIQALLASETLRAKSAPAGEHRPQTSLAAAPAQGAAAPRSTAASRLVDFETADHLAGIGDRR